MKSRKKTRPKLLNRELGQSLLWGERTKTLALWSPSTLPMPLPQLWPTVLLQAWHCYSFINLGCQENPSVPLFPVFKLHPAGRTSVTNHSETVWHLQALKPAQVMRPLHPRWGQNTQPPWAQLICEMRSTPSGLNWSLPPWSSLCLACARPRVGPQHSRFVTLSSLKS